MTSTDADATVGTGSFRYRANADWARLPPGWSLREVVAVATDSKGRVFVFNRGDHPVVVFQSDGAFLFAWGEGVFARPHGITIDKDDSVYCTDDFGHVVRKFTVDGKLLLTLGSPGQPSDTGATSVDYRTIRRVGPPFHYPTNVAVATNGALFIADGYGNARIHHFSADGTLVRSWGAIGNGPGAFHVPHGIALAADGTLYVADRENDRLQLFNTEGKFLAEWPDLARPCEVTIDGQGNVYVAELGYRAGMWPGVEAPGPDATGGRVSILDRRGRLLARWGGGRTPHAAGDFFAPHDIHLDRDGNLYVSEVVLSAGGASLPVPGHALQKFTRLA